MKLIDGLGGPGEVLGHGLPDWPADLLTFKERRAYQRGVADARCVAKAIAAAAPQPELTDAHIMRFMAPWNTPGDVADRADLIKAVRAMLAEIPSISVEVPTDAKILEHVGRFANDFMERAELVLAVRTLLAPQPASAVPGAGPDAQATGSSNG